MPKMSERDRLSDLEARHRKVAEELDRARHALRGRYGSIVTEMTVERIPEREFREIVAQAIRVGGSASISALKVLPARSADD